MSWHKLKMYKKYVILIMKVSTMTGKKIRRWNNLAYATNQILEYVDLKVSVI